MQKKVIISPLDWGLGHTSRIVPVIKQYIDQNFQVIIACNAEQQLFLKRFFPNLLYLNLKGYQVEYAKHHFFFVKLFFQLPKIVFSIFFEHIQLRFWVKKFTPNLILSDNRYGFFHFKVKSIFITHQVYPIIPVFQFLIHLLLHLYLKFFDEIHVPDINQSVNYSGVLSHGKNLDKHLKYKGLLSQFQIIDNNPSPVNPKRVLFLLSGVEPQRTILESKLLNNISPHYEYVLIRGKQAAKLIDVPENVTIINWINAAELKILIEESNFIVARSGYSTLMDLTYLKKKNVLLIPTPGQTEQEYLAKHFNLFFGFYSQNQENIDLKKFLEK